MALLARTVAIGLALAWFTLALPAWSDDRAASRQPDGAQIAGWIAELGSERFAVRERATRQLFEAGIAARDALAAAAADPDAEVRVRARTVLSQVSAADFRDRLEAFAADYDGSQHRTLPGWDRYSAMFGSGIAARHLFVDMQRAEGELFEALANDPDSAGDALEARCRAIVKLATTSYGAGRISIGTIASVFFVAGIPEVRVDDYLGAQFLPWLGERANFLGQVSGGEHAPLLRKLVGLWAAKPGAPIVGAESMKLAARFDLKIEALGIARRLLGDERSPAPVRQNALMIVGKYGDQSDVAQAEKFLTDGTPCGNLQMPGIGQPVEFQLRDVALTTVVQLSGQKPRDYGFVYVMPAPVTIFQTSILIFARTQDRDAAMKKWATWRSEHPAS